MRVIIMAATIEHFLSKGLSHELKDMERGSSAVVPKGTYVLIEYADETKSA